MRSNKRSILAYGAILSVALFALIFLQKGNYCYSTDWCRNLWDTLNLAGYILFPFPLVFLFSLITYFLPEAIFRAWIRFTTWWVPAQIVLTLLTPESSGGLFISLVDKQLTAIVLSFFFATISLVLIIWKSFVSRRTN